jgi:hypothetical protein
MIANADHRSRLNLVSCIQTKLAKKKSQPHGQLPCLTQSLVFRPS